MKNILEYQPNLLKKSYLHGQIVGVFNKMTRESCSNKIKRDEPAAKAKDEMIKLLSWLHTRPRGGIIGRGAEVSPIKLLRPRGVEVSPLKKTPSIPVFGLALTIKKALLTSLTSCKQRANLPISFDTSQVLYLLLFSACVKFLPLCSTSENDTIKIAFK